MTVVACIFLPFVLLYQAWTYWVFRKRLGAPPQPPEALTGDLLAATAGRTVLLITRRRVPAAQVDQVLRLTGGFLAEIPPAGDRNLPHPDLQPR
jgi:hypothetical protein